MTVGEAVAAVRAVRALRVACRRRGLSGGEGEALLAIVAHSGDRSDVCEEAIGLTAGSRTVFRRSYLVLAARGLVMSDRRRGVRTPVYATLDGRRVAAEVVADAARLVAEWAPAEGLEEAAS